MSKIKLFVGTATLAIVAGLCGCMTHRVQTVTASGATNTVVAVDEANLAIDASVLQGVTATAVSLLKVHQPGVVQALTDAHVALDGIINGANTNTTQDVVNLLKAQNNPELTREVTGLVKTISAVEQKLVLKYGSIVAGEISLALAKAVDGGIVVGLGL